MTKKTLVILLVVLFVVVALYFVLGSTSGGDQGQNASLLSGIDGEHVAKIVLEQGTDKTEITRDGEGWIVPSRGGYPANAQEVLSLLLKVFDLSSSQRIPTGPESIKKLELDEEGLKQGRLRISFFDSDGKELGGLYFGKTRMTEPKLVGGRPIPPVAGGQYVRSINGKQVYLISIPITFSASATNWIKTKLMNVLQANVGQVEQRSGIGTSESTDFVIKRSAETAKLEFVGEVPAEHTVKADVISQIGSALENLRITDVKQAASKDMKQLKFDRKTIFQASNGLVYTVESAQKDDKIYARFGLTFDESLAKKLKLQHENLVKEAEEKEKEQEKDAKESSKGTKDASQEGVNKDSKSAKTKKPAPLLLSNAKEADKLSGQFKPWVFEFQSFQGEKFRKSTDDLFQKKVEEEKKGENKS